MFANNSQYEANLNSVFRDLSNNATNSNRYHQAVSNNGNTTGDGVYGHFLCRPDQNTSTCHDCVTTATTTDLPNTYCPNRKDAIIWYDDCIVRYSNESFFGMLNVFPSVIFSNTTRNITGNISSFNANLDNFLTSIAVRAANGGSQLKFAAGFVNFTSSINIYGLGQCTPDLSASDCNLCLESGIGSFPNTRGGRAVMPSCVVRYEVYPFFNFSSLPPSPNPAPATPSSGKVTNLTLINSCNYTVWPGILSNVYQDDSTVNVPTGFSLPQGESKIIDIPPNWSGSMWGRTLCSVDKETGNFSCQTGECGTGKVECEGASSFTHPATVADFRIGLIENTDKYDINLASGYNLPMMVAPQGYTGNGCAVTGCVFILDNGTCPSEFRVFNHNSRMIGCRNPCDVQVCCQNDILCQNSDYLDSSLLFQKYCPRAHINPSDLSTTTFSCESYQTSYYVTFCPSPTDISEFSRPYQFIPESISPSPLPLASPGGSTLSSPADKNKTSTMKVVVAIVVPLAVSALLIALCTYFFHRKAKMYNTLDIRNVLEDFPTPESLMFELRTLQVATNYFSDDQKLGVGGFGSVYKGTLPNGQDIAVKRLLLISQGGIEAFKNEVLLIAKLQHKNLVRLLGFCLEGEEKLLVYEFVPNKSLNYLLFDPRRKGELDWSMRYNIIAGIARGLLYLHEDSRPRIIHRDLKAANILLEADMNPKIADFGLARIFKVEQTQDDTSIIAGTFGYMAPEYAMHGQYSIKSDVYSFGVLLLEIVSGKRVNSRFHPTREGDLFTLAWRSWQDETPSEILDPTLRDSYSTDEVLRCIHLGLLCVQENSHDRPTMSTIVFMLNTNSTTKTLSTPQPPRTFYDSSTDSAHVMTRSKQHSTTTMSSSDSMSYSHNQSTASEMNTR